MPIRYKFITSLLLLTASCLAVYIWIAKSVFENDKEVAVFESASQTSSAQALMLEQQINDTLEYSKAVVSNYDPQSLNFTASGRNLFDKKKVLLAIGILENGKFILFQSKDPSLNSDDLVQKFSQESASALALNENGKIGISVSIRNSDEQINKSLIVVTDLRERLSLLDFSEEGGGSFLAVGERPISDQAEFPGEFAQKLLAAMPMQKNMKEQTSIQDVDKKSFLISSRTVPVGGLRIMTVIPKDLAFMGIHILYKKSVQFFALIFFIVLLVSVLMTRTLLRNLDRLTSVTSEVSKGNFDVQVGVKSKDEFGKLASSFQRMSQEIKRLISETREKARMEAELQTAQAVQENLFPTPVFKSQALEINGLYRPASECGGDWWYHFEHPTGVYVFICDATGHGAPAALITAAAKATVNLMMREKELNLQKLTEAFNYSLYETAKGNLLMTGFVLQIKSDFSLEYVNASHEPPLIIKDAEVDFLMEPNGPRFGQNPDTKYQTAQVQDLKGKQLLLYTDGITSQKNKEGKELGDKKLLRFLKKVQMESVSLADLNKDIFSLVDEFREEVHQEDDLTIVTIRFP